MRQLMVTAAGTAGGNAGEKMFTLLRKELQALDGDQVKPEPECETPLSREDFERMMSEE